MPANKIRKATPSRMPINPEGHAFTRADKRHAEGVTALPKARLSALAVVCSLQSGPKNTVGIETQPGT
jgi:hypothetical protein